MALEHPKDTYSPNIVLRFCQNFNILKYFKCVVKILFFYEALSAKISYISSEEIIETRYFDTLYLLYTSRKQVKFICSPVPILCFIALYARTEAV